MKIEDLRNEFDYTVKVDSFNGEIVMPLPEWQIESFEKAAQEELDQDITKSESIYIDDVGGVPTLDFLNNLTKEKKLDPKTTRIYCNESGDWYIDYAIILTKSEYIKKLKRLLDHRKMLWRNIYTHMVLVMKTSESARAEFMNWNREEKLKRIVNGKNRI